MQDMTQAAGCIFFIGMSRGWSAHPDLAEATGVAAIAAVSHSGPNRTNSKAARTSVASVRKRNKEAARAAMNAV